MKLTYHHIRDDRVKHIESPLSLSDENLIALLKKGVESSKRGYILVEVKLK